MRIKLTTSIYLMLILMSVSMVIVNRANARVQTGGRRTMKELKYFSRPVTQVSDRQLKIAELRKQIAGQEEKPAAEVFKNIKNFKNLPAGQLPLVMNAFSRALGVDCEHCHMPDKWESEDKPQKQIAREMMKMTGTINATLLADIKNLKSTKPEISCSTCHGGHIVPNTKLPVN